MRGLVDVMSHPWQHGETRHRIGPDCFVATLPPAARAAQLTWRNDGVPVRVVASGAALRAVLQDGKWHKYVAVERPSCGVEFHVAGDGDHQALCDPHHERMVGAGLMVYDVAAGTIMINGFSSTFPTFLYHVHTDDAEPVSATGLFAVRAALDALLDGAARVEVQLEPALPLRVDGDDVVIDAPVRAEQWEAVHAHLMLQSPGLAVVVAPDQPDPQRGWIPAFNLCSALWSQSDHFASLTIRGPLAALLAPQ